MADFLLELRSEEIPARMQGAARAELEKLFRREMEAAGVTVGEMTVWSTPRRLALIARGLPEATKASATEIKGPRVGAPDQAIDGFLRRYEAKRDDLIERNGIYFLEQMAAGRLMTRVLQEAIPEIVEAFSWPKSMRWGAASISTGSLRWVRPLSGIVALLGEELVECEVGGIASGYATRGHRFHAPGSITIGSAADYQDKLRSCHVIVDHEERAAMIREGAARVAAEAGLALVEDEGLVVENAGLTEWPVPLLGRFDEAYLDVPPEVIQLTARVNQKYFVCTDTAGKLANAFICTANIDAIDPGVVVDGNRKVLAARLSDARFFWEQDIKTPLAQHARGLERITFHEKLGTVADKAQRVAKLARWLCEEGIVTDASFPAGEGASLADMAEAAARLCKADLVTGMVGEFPELQGIMGGYYARAEGLPDEVADAIRDHYKPVGQGDEVPTAPVTVAVSLADKLDTLITFFSVDLRPTGSKDPFALRRTALGIIALIVRNELRFRLGGLFRYALSRFRLTLLAGVDVSSIPIYRDYGDKNFDLEVIGDTYRFTYAGESLLEWEKDATPNLDMWQFIALRDDVEAGLWDFVADRLKVQQREAGVRHDLIDAVFALGGEDDLVRLLARVHALQSFITTENGANLLAGYKRAANILKKEGWPAQTPLPFRGGAGGGDSPQAPYQPDSPHPPTPSPEGEGELPLSYTPEPAEKAFIDALEIAEPKAGAAIEAEDFAAAMSALASLRAPIDRFFDEVTVNADEENKRAARLELLARFRAAVHKVADFSRIEG